MENELPLGDKERYLAGKVDHCQDLNLPRDIADPVTSGKGQNDGRDTGNHRIEQGIGQQLFAVLESEI